MRLRMGLALFDRNHDGKLDAEERENLLRVVQTMMPQ
jgi:Ca2+-binding EF-hand superfamily protein